MIINKEVYENMVEQFYEDGKDHKNYDNLFRGLKEEVEEVGNCDNDEELLYELGDVLWYVTMIARSKGWTLGEVMISNVSKLEARALNGKNT